jgi:hypothetical protein
MKVILLSTARSRSSVIVNSYSQKYQITNLFEEYKDVCPENVSKLVFFHRQSDLLNKFKKLTKEKTDKIFHDNPNGFVIKLFPVNILNDFQYNPEFAKNSNWHITEDSLLDLEEYFQISKYDKIIITYRKNTCDQICSWWHAYNKKIFLTNNEQDVSALTPKGKIEIDTPYPLYTLKSTIVYKKYLEYISTYLDKKNLKYTLLEYHDVPKYLEDNFSNITLSTVDTKYDYKNQIENYNSLNETIEKLEQEVEKEFKNFF